MFDAYGCRHKKLTAAGRAAKDTMKNASVLGSAPIEDPLLLKVMVEKTLLGAGYPIEFIWSAPYKEVMERYHILTSIVVGGNK